MSANSAEKFDECFLIIDCSSVSFIDYMGLNALKEVGLYEVKDENLKWSPKLALVLSVLKTFSFFLEQKGELKMP